MAMERTGSEEHTRHVPLECLVCTQQWQSHVCRSRALLAGSEGPQPLDFIPGDEWAGLVILAPSHPVLGPL